MKANAFRVAKNKGFTLLEVMIVIAILGMLASMVVPNLMNQTDDAAIKKTAIDIGNIEKTLELYYLKARTYPTTEQGLEALVTMPEIEPIPRNYPEGGFLPKVPVDSWGNEFQLVYPGEMGKFDLFSMGPDGEAGTEDDIGNWNKDEFL